MTMIKRPGPQGLYNPAYEHDACGVAMVAKLDTTDNFNEDSTWTEPPPWLDEAQQPMRRAAAWCGR